MMSSNLPCTALDLTIALLKLAEKLDEREMHSASHYILKHGLRVSDYVHRTRRLNSKYKCIRNFNIAIFELDKAINIVVHLHNRGVITDEELGAIKPVFICVRLLLLRDLARYKLVPDWYKEKE